VCDDGYIVSHDNLTCVENTICGFTDADKQAYCRNINDPVTTVHMNGCRKLSTDYTLRDRVEDDTFALMIQQSNTTENSIPQRC